MNSWQTYEEREEMVNYGKYLEVLQEECRKFCKLVVDEAGREGAFDRAHQKT